MRWTPPARSRPSWRGDRGRLAPGPHPIPLFRIAGNGWLMRTTLAILAAAAVLSGAFYLFSSSGAEEVSLASNDGSRPFLGKGPLTETAVLFGMLVGLGLAGTRITRRA